VEAGNRREEVSFLIDRSRFLRSFLLSRSINNFPKYDIRTID